MLTANQLKAELDGYHGTESYHRWSILFRNMVLTDGAQALADKGRCYWLMDAIASYLPQMKRHEQLSQIAFWNLKKDGNKAVLTCRVDSGYKPSITQKFEYTDFPMDVDLWVQPLDAETYVIMLPSEY